MQKRKGFTLVELVIVIAVIAILAGVLIGTFASVLNKAQESARMQEIKAQEHEQKADDLLKKIENSNWYGWEDFETSIVEKITAAIDNAKKELNQVNVQLDSQAVSKAVSEAMTKYYAENAMGNTALTEEQVKAIIENALGSFKYEGVTKAQVESVVNAAVSKMSTGLSAQQVKTIVNAAAEKVEAGQLTVGQITAIVANAFAQNKVDTTGLATSAQVEAIVTAIEDKNCSKLTAEQVETIINSALAKAGTTSWVSPEEYADPTKTTFALTTTEDVQGLATLVNGGYDFENKVIVLPEEVNLTNKEFVPIGNTRGSEFKGTLGGESATKKTTITGLTLEQEFNAIMKGYLINCSSTGQMDKVGVGFVAYLGEGAILQNVDFVDVNVDIRTTNLNGVYFDGVSVGVAVGMLDGGIIDNVNVVSGTIKSVYRTAGLVGAADHGTITDCTVGTSTAKFNVESTGEGAYWYKDTEATDKDPREPGYYPVNGNSNYCSAAGLLGYVRDFDKSGNSEITISGVSINANIKGSAVADITAQWNDNVKINDITGGGAKANVAGQTGSKLDQAITGVTVDTTKTVVTLANS